jgi:hypothetical protein
LLNVSTPRADWFLQGWNSATTIDFLFPGNSDLEIDLGWEMEKADIEVGTVK